MIIISTNYHSTIPICLKVDTEELPDKRHENLLLPNLKSKEESPRNQMQSPGANRKHLESAPYLSLFNTENRTSLVTRWIRIHLPTKGMWVGSLVCEDPTWCGATKPKRHNSWAHVLQLLKPVHLESVLHTPQGLHSQQPEKALTKQWRPSAAKNTYTKTLKKF